MSHDDYVKRADAICSAYRTQAAPLASPRSYGAIVAWGQKTLPVYAAALQQLEGLQPPAEDAKAVRAWLAADRRVQRALRDLVTGAQKRDFPSVNAAASRAQLAGSQARRAATTLGFSVCGTFSAR